MLNWMGQTLIFKLLVVICVSLRRTDTILVTLCRYSLGDIVLLWSQSQKVVQNQLLYKY
ncbi:hypothetical protein I79_023472 [Cricetulus griseus]|uniref:Uncharacterized protein n=1 Tax=Cricetulus griseus TaxID=10029 RepID=G3II11_CRIGR|nr:hypothetical protein I79_023472 [Cricetulus griseus]